MSSPEISLPPVLLPCLTHKSSPFELYFAKKKSSSLSALTNVVDPVKLPVPINSAVLSAKNPVI